MEPPCAATGSLQHSSAFLYAAVGEGREASNSTTSVIALHDTFHVQVARSKSGCHITSSSMYQVQTVIQRTGLPNIWTFINYPLPTSKAGRGDDSQSTAVEQGCQLLMGNLLCIAAGGSK